MIYGWTLMLPLCLFLGGCSPRSLSCVTTCESYVEVQRLVCTTQCTP